MSTVVAEEAVYNLVYESGYFMNELAKCIGTDLSSYNDKKSQAIAYLGDSKDLAYKPGYLADVIRAYEVDLQQKGYTLAQARAMDPADIEAIIMDIIRETYFSDYRTLDVELINTCKDYFKPVEDSFIDSTEAFEDNGVKVDSMEKYVVNTASKLSGNFLYEAIVGYLNDALQAKLAK
jgi:hypothetical protein